MRVRDKQQFGVFYTLFSANLLNLFSKHYFFSKWYIRRLRKRWRSHKTKNLSWTRFYLSLEKVIKLMLYRYSSTDNFFSPIADSDWLIFCCVNVDTSSKKEMKMIKMHFLNEKQEKDNIKRNLNRELHYLLWTFSTDP